MLNTTHKNEILVHFTLTAPNARQVAVVGDWNSWQPDINKLVDDDGDGVWELKLKISAGKEYRYQFLIDGERWVPDPNSLINLADGFGGVDSVLQL
jgi:1,4-alpha-glucan branching enzyme